MALRTRGNQAALHKKLLALGREVRTLRSGLISMIGEDPEGSYRPEFVKEILKAAEEPPTRRFVNAGRFLASLRGR